MGLLFFTWGVPMAQCGYLVHSKGEGCGVKHPQDANALVTE